MQFQNSGFLEISFFNLEDINQGSSKLHAIEVYNQTTSHKKLVILAFIGDKLAGGRFCPLPGHVVLNPIPERGLK